MSRAKLLKATDVAERANVSRARAYEIMRAIPHFKLERSIRVEEHDLRDWAEATGVDLKLDPPPPPPPRKLGGRPRVKRTFDLLDEQILAIRLGCDITTARSELRSGEHTRIGSRISRLTEEQFIQRWPDLAWMSPNLPIFQYRAYIPAHVRRFVLERDGHACRYCGVGGKLVLEHLHPLILAGTDEPDNLVAACQSCNNKKGAKTLEDSGMRLRPVPR